MTLFTLLIVMALERVVVKTNSLHITNLAQYYFAFISPFFDKKDVATPQKSNNATITMLLVAGLPALAVGLLVVYLPAILVFFLYILLLWVCLGCPLTRQTYKRYLQAATRQDFEACSLYSEQLGNKEGDLAHVGEHLVFINYKQYASVIVFFVILGLPGMVFYAVCSQWSALRQNKAENIDPNSDLNTPRHFDLDTSIQADENDSADDASQPVVSESISESEIRSNDTQSIMFFLDWLPSRITAFGFLLVGHFSRGLPVWLDTFTNDKLTAFEVLAKVAKASEELSGTDNPELDEPLQMVKLAKRNIIFLLMVISLMTLVGVVS